jgi:dihydroorotase/N-acyl-D-amino-acid deacylase
LGIFTGTGTTRAYVKAFDSSPFKEPEMKEMQRLLAEALDEGAMGISMGIMFVPECFGSTDEFVKMAAPLRGTGKPLAIHIRGEGNSLVNSVWEALEIGRRAEVPVHISQFKAAGANNWRKAVPEAIALIEKARESQDVTVDFYPYTGSSTSIISLIPPAFLGNDWPASLRTLSTRAGIDRFKTMMESDYEKWDNFVKMLGWDRIFVSALKTRKNAEGKSITELAGNSDPTEFAARLILEEEGQIAIIVQSMCQDDIDTIAKLPYSSVISDALYADTDYPHPRLYGSFPRIIREYVRERGILPMGEAIRKMTSLPAARINLEKKGFLKPGFDADILLFDGAALHDNASFKEPAKQASGISRVILGGKTVYLEDEFLQRNTGILLR